MIQKTSCFKNSRKKKFIDNTKEIHFNAVNSIVQEDGDSTVKINYKNSKGFNASINFDFSDYSMNSLFFEFLQGELRYNKMRERLTSLKAAAKGVTFLMIAIGLTLLFYYDAVEVENGDARRSVLPGAVISRFVVGILGTTGVLICGGLFTLFALFHLWSRVTKPPFIAKYIPPIS